MVSVDPATQEYTILGEFQWPKSDVFGCPILDSPTVTFDKKSQTLFMEFFSTGMGIIEMDVAKAKM